MKNDVICCEWGDQYDEMCELQWIIVQTTWLYTHYTHYLLFPVGRYLTMPPIVTYKLMVVT